MSLPSDWAITSLPHMNEISICVSLTTIPSKFRYLQSTVDSLVRQTRPATRIIINIPTKYSLRFDRSIPDPEITAFMKRYEHTQVSINKVQHDYGPGTKLLGLLERNVVDRAADRPYVVLVDDDVTYDPNMLRMFCEAIEQEHAQFASFRCYWINGVPIGQGVDGFLIDMTLLDLYTDYYDVIKSEDYVAYHDDVYLSYFFFLSGIRLTFIPFKSYRFRHMGWIDALSSIDGKYTRDNVRNQTIEILDRLNREGRFEFIRRRFRTDVLG